MRKAGAMNDRISRLAALDTVRHLQTYKLAEGDEMLLVDLADVQTELMMMPTAEPEIIHCRDCEYGEIDRDNWWFCRNFGRQVGEPDGSGFCADAERKNNV